jgi:hypothetical protein
MAWLISLTVTHLNPDRHGLVDSLDFILKDPDRHNMVDILDCNSP